MRPELPSTNEIRRWAEGLGLPVSPTGSLPHGLIKRWNATFPERPFVASERWHGTGSGYNAGCRCQACQRWGVVSSRDRREARAEDLKWQDNGVLDLDQGAS